MPLLAGSSVANTGSTYGTSSTTASSGGTQIWGAVSNAYSTSGYANSALGAGQQTSYLVCKGFGFSIPSTASIVGVVFSYKGYANSSSAAQDYQVSLFNTTAIGTAKSTGGYLNTTPTIISYGNSSDMWGLYSGTLNPTIVNGSNFGIGLSLQSVSGSVGVYANSMSLTVYYSSSSSIWFDDNNGDIGIPPPVQYQTRTVSIRVPATNDEAATTLSSWSVFNPGQNVPPLTGAIPNPEIRFWSNPARTHQPPPESYPFGSIFSNQLPSVSDQNPQFVLRKLPTRTNENQSQIIPTSFLKLSIDQVFACTQSPAVQPYFARLNRFVSAELPIIDLATVLLPKIIETVAVQPMRTGPKSESIVTLQPVFNSALFPYGQPNVPNRPATKTVASQSAETLITSLTINYGPGIFAAQIVPTRTSTPTRLDGQPPLNSSWQYDPVLLGLSWNGRDQQPLPRPPGRHGSNDLIVFDTANARIWPITQQPDRIQPKNPARIPNGDPVSLSALVWSFQVLADVSRPIIRLRQQEHNQPVTNLGDVAVWSDALSSQIADRILPTRKPIQILEDHSGQNNLSNTNATNPQFAHIHTPQQIPVFTKPGPRQEANQLGMTSLFVAPSLLESTAFRPIIRQTIVTTGFPDLLNKFQIVIVPGPLRIIAGQIYQAGAVTGNAQIN